MTVPARASLPAPQTTLGQRAVDILIWGGLAALLISGFKSAEIFKMTQLFAGSENMRRLGAEFIKPDFTDWRPYVANMWITIQMALWGTVLAAMLGYNLSYGWTFATRLLRFLRSK